MRGGNGTRRHLRQAEFHRLRIRQIDLRQAEFHPLRIRQIGQLHRQHASGRNSRSDTVYFQLSTLPRDTLALRACWRS